TTCLCAVFDHTFTFGGARPAEDFRFFVLETGGGDEEIFELLSPADREIAGFFEGIETRHFDGNDDEAVVAEPLFGAFFILFQANNAERAAFDHGSGIGGEIAEYHGVEWITVRAES